MKPSRSADWVMSQLQEQNSLWLIVILKMMLVSLEPLPTGWISKAGTQKKEQHHLLDSCLAPTLEPKTSTPWNTEKNCMVSPTPPMRER